MEMTHFWTSCQDSSRYCSFEQKRLYGWLPS